MSLRVKSLSAAVALVAAGGLAWLGTASAFDGGSKDGLELAQASPPAAMPPAAGGPDRPAAMPERRAISPKEMCVDHVARRIGNRAYLKARLDLTPEQMPLWTAFEKAADEASAKDKARCASLPAETKTPPNFMERYTRRDERMRARVESLEAVKPSLQALYASLTPEQKAILDRPMMGGMHMHHHRG